jgi:hypothetical protein
MHRTIRRIIVMRAGLVGIVSLMLIGANSFAGNSTNSAAFPPLALPGPGGYDPAVAALDSCNRGGRNALGDVYLINTVMTQCQQSRTVQARDTRLSGQVSTCWSYTSQWTNLELQAESIEQQAAKTPNGQAAGSLMNQAQATLDQARSILITQAVCTNGLINSDQFAANDGTNRGGGTHGESGNNGGNGSNAPPNNPTVGGGGNIPSGPGATYQAPMPGPAGGIGYRPGPNACLPQGPGGYDYCKNGPGARLPPGCSCGGPPVAQNRSPPARSGYVDSHEETPNNPTPGGPDGRASVPVTGGNSPVGTPGEGAPSLAPIRIHTNVGSAPSPYRPPPAHISGGSQQTPNVSSPPADSNQPSPGAGKGVPIDSAHSTNNKNPVIAKLGRNWLDVTDPATGKHWYFRIKAPLVDDYGKDLVKLGEPQYGVIDEATIGFGTYNGMINSAAKYKDTSGDYAQWPLPGTLTRPVNP